MCLAELSFVIRPERRITKGSADTAVIDNYFLKYSDLGWFQISGSRSFLDNKWRHLHISASVEDWFILSYAIYYLSFYRFEGKNFMQFVFCLSSTLCGRNDVKIRYLVNQVMPKCWKWWLHNSMSNFGCRIKTCFEVRSHSRRKLKKARSENLFDKNFIFLTFLSAKRVLPLKRWKCHGC